MSPSIVRRLAFLEGKLGDGCGCLSAPFQLVEAGQAEEATGNCAHCGRPPPLLLLVNPYPTPQVLTCPPEHSGHVAPTSQSCCSSEGPI